MRNIILVMSILLLAAMAGNAAAEIGVRSIDAAKPDAGSGQRPTAGPTDSVFAHFARSLASALTDPEVRRMVHQEVGRQFDGDFNALYRDLANHKLSDGSTFRGRLAAHAAAATEHRALRSRSASLQVLDGYAAALPRLQIAMPVHFGEWDPEAHVPLVAYMPDGIDDTDLVEVPAYDAAGKVHLLDARVPPTMPVIVVSLNERTDDLGFITAFAEAPLCDPETAIEPCDDGGGGGGGGGTVPSTCTSRTHSYGDKEILYQIKVNNDHEPWTSGSAEIYATYSTSNGARGRFNMNHVDDEGTWYTINGHLFYWQSNYGDILVNAIWEDDGGPTWTANYNFLGITFTVNIENGDDDLGAAPIGFNDPTCGYYSTGDAEFKMRHTAP